MQTSLYGVTYINIAHIAIGTIRSGVLHETTYKSRRGENGKEKRKDRRKMK